MQGVLAGRYRLERQLGKGGMGSVWLAEHLALRSWVAVKLMDPAIAATAEGAERFRREAQAAASLRSAHVVQVLDYGVPTRGAGRPQYVAMAVAIANDEVKGGGVHVGLPLSNDHWGAHTSLAYRTPEEVSVCLARFVVVAQRADALIRANAERYPRMGPVRIETNPEHPITVW